jgi:hypothetical protein
MEDIRYAIMEFIDNENAIYSTHLCKRNVTNFINIDIIHEHSFVLEHAYELLHKKRDNVECIFRNIQYIRENEELECNEMLNATDETAIIQFIFEPFPIFTNFITFNKINQFIIKNLCNRNNKNNKLLIEFATNNILNRRNILEQKYTLIRQ